MSRRRMLALLGYTALTAVPGSRLLAAQDGKPSWVHSLYVERKRPDGPHDDTVSLRVLSRVSAWRLYSTTVDIHAPEARLVKDTTPYASLDGLWPVQPHSHSQGDDGLWRAQVTLLTPAREYRLFWLVTDPDRRYRTDRVPLIVEPWPTDGVLRVTP